MGRSGREGTAMTRILVAAVAAAVLAAAPAAAQPRGDPGKVLRVTFPASFGNPSGSRVAEYSETSPVDRFSCIHLPSL